MKSARLMLVGAAALALAAGAAYAADKPKSGFDALDKDNDGVISKVEAAASPRLAKRFDAVDKNNDGKLNRSEYRAGTAKKSAKKPVKTTANEPRNRDAGFNKLDRNNDGKLNRAEYAAGTAKKPVKTAANEPRNRDAGFNKLDRNNDGYITRAETRGNPGLAKNFNAADRNDDGRLNRAEYLAATTKKDLNVAKRKIDNADGREPRASTGGTAASPP